MERWSCIYSKSGSKSFAATSVLNNLPDDLFDTIFGFGFSREGDIDEYIDYLWDGESSLLGLRVEVEEP